MTLKLPDFCHYCGEEKPIVRKVRYYTQFFQKFGYDMKPCCDRCWRLMRDGHAPANSKPSDMRIRASLEQIGKDMQAFNNLDSIEALIRVQDDIDELSKVRETALVEFQLAADEAALAAQRLSLFDKAITDAKEAVEMKLNANYERCREVANQQIRDPEIRKAVFDAHGSVCKFCGTTSFLSIDHIIPVRQGGTNDISNLQPLCVPCNSQKGGRITRRAA